MKIFNYIKGFNLSLDQETALTNLESFLGGSDKIFILKGYAGSGKTTILKCLIDYLESDEKEVEVIAPTGRAAKVLRDKTLKGTTIHRGIYNFDKLIPIEVENEDVANKSFHFYFPIAEKAITNRVIIVDEASMISNMRSQHELFTFGTGKLLDDLLTYANIHNTNNKIIFVGDPAQLPPVTDNKSLALDASFFRAIGLPTQEIEMTGVFRQERENLIFSNSIKIREVLEESQRNTLSFDFDDSEFLHLADEMGPSKYVSLFPKPKIGDSVILSYSNNQAFSNNLAIREKVFPNQEEITKGDILILNNNNYHTYEIDLFNGDMMEVVGVSNKLETLSAPVWVNDGQQQTRKNVSLAFRDVQVQVPHYKGTINCKIIDSFLNSGASSLSVTELKALYINFVMRFKEKQKLRKEQGMPSFSEGSVEFKAALKVDPYFNALKVKYGYAITCHKAQGSEWDTVFVDFRSRVGLNDDCLRWSYTAITRAEKVCYSIHAPNFDVFGKIKFEETGIINAYPKDAFQFPNNLISAFHSEGGHPCKVLKYNQVLNDLKDTPFELVKVVSQEWLEIYYLLYQGVEFRVQGTHGKNGIFNPFTVVNSDKEDIDHLLSIFNKSLQSDFEVNYTPTSESADKLYKNVCLAMQGVDIEITNIVEFIPQYFIKYNFKSKEQFGYMQFYFNKNMQFTKAVVKVLNTSSFPELNELISKF
ncbi:AAA family ATPase [uncultured Arcticibacterium sp.]|uniref:ATP-dependent DNA helicase n=1 Tax=uncultured Arcticibacterium sp. TaxID=2173042 RepID=UPI0030F832B4